MANCDPSWGVCVTAALPPKADCRTRGMPWQLRAMYGRCPRCKSKSDFSAKRSGAAMYTAYFRSRYLLDINQRTVRRIGVYVDPSSGAVFEYQICFDGVLPC